MTIAPAVLALVVGGCNAIFGVTGGQPGAVCLTARPAICAPANLTDAENCCAPGRTCRGGACSEGECGAVLITSNKGEEAVEVLVASDLVIWSSGSARKLYAASTSAGDGTKRVLGTTEGTAFQNISTLAADGDHVYFTDHTSPDIGRIPLAGGPAEVFVTGNPNDLPPGGSRAPSIAVAGGYVYWAGPATGIFRASIAGPIPAKEEKVADAINSYGVAVDDAYVYWADYSTSTIRRLAFAKIGPGAVSEVIAASTPQFVVFVAVDADSVVWSTDAEVDIAPKQGGNQTYTVLSNETDSSPNEIWADGRDVFWTTVAYAMGQKGGRLRRISKKGGPVHTIAQNDSPFGLGGLAGNCDTVFWLDGKTISLMRATR